MDQKHLRRLQSQVKDDRRKSLQGKPKRPEDRIEFLDEDFNEHEDYETLPPHQRRLCMISNLSNSLDKTSGTTKSRLQKNSTKKLLEASLISLETLGRQIVTKDSNNRSSSNINTTFFDETEKHMYPSETYLRGALWMGRNLVILLEELTESLDSLRSKLLNEISLASHDDDPRRSSHRLSLLAGTSISEVLAKAHKSRHRAREILQVSIKKLKSLSIIN